MGTLEETIRTLQTYQSVSGFKKIQEKRELIDSVDLFNRGAYGPFLDAWVLVRVAAVMEEELGKIKIRLVPETEQFPDAKMLIGQNEYDFEITEVMEPGRKRGDEYKEKHENKVKGTNEEVQLVGHLFDEGSRQGAKWIANGIERKVKKRYSVKSHLIIHANFLCYELIPDLLAAESMVYRDAFESIWIVHNNAVLQLFDSKVFGKTDSLWHPYEIAGKN